MDRNVCHATRASAIARAVGLTADDTWAHCRADVPPRRRVGDVRDHPVGGCARVPAARSRPEAALDLLRRRARHDHQPGADHAQPDGQGAPARADARATRCASMLSGGAPIAPDVVRRILDTFGCDYVQTYGMTETSPYLTLSLLPPEELRRSCRSTQQLHLEVQDRAAVPRRPARGRRPRRRQRPSPNDGEGGRRDPRARRDRDAGLLAERRGDRGRVRRRRVPVHRRPRQRSTSTASSTSSTARRTSSRRARRRSTRSRSSTRALRPSRRARVRRIRQARRQMGRARRRRHRAAPRRAGDRRTS